MSNPILAMIPSGYNAADAKLYSILPSDGSGDFTVSVDADATRVNKDGLIEGVALNQARLTYDPLNPECPSLLLETERTNRQVRSEELDNVSWSKTNTTVTANQTTAPTGELTADKLSRTSTAANYVSGLSSKSASSQLDAVSSVFVKQGQGDFIAFRAQGSYPNRADAIFQFSTKTLTTSVSGSNFSVTSSQVQDYGNGWYRLSIVYNTDTAATLASLLSPRATSGQVDATDTSTTAFAYVWGVQFEEGSTLSSYIPTTAIATRTNDVCKDAGNADLFNVSELSLFIDVNNFNPDGFSYIVLTDGVSSPINMVRLDYTQNSILIRWYNNGTLTFSYDITSVITNQRNKLLISFGIQAKVYFNGILKNTTSISDVPNGFDSLSFTNRTESGGYFQGEVYDARVYDTVLTEAEAIKLTT